MIQNISKITIYVENQAEAKKFWIDKLNFVVSEEQDMGQGIKWLEVSPTQKAGTSFILYEKELMHHQNPKANTNHPSVILSTDDIDSCYASLENKNVSVSPMMTMPYGRMFTFHDQDGNAYLIREDK